MNLLLPDTWKNLTTAALLGTERGRFDTATLPSEFASEGQPAGESALLSAAAMIALYRRAGRLPQHHEAKLETAPSDRLPVCAPRAVSYLRVMLQGKHTAALPEWLELAARRGRRVPYDILPELLDAGRKQRALRSGITRVIDARGAWLAAQNPEWRYAVGANDEGDEEDAWETGLLPARVAVLRRKRAFAPDEAREMLVSVWPQEPLEARTAFLPVLAVGLSPADEPFLESALDDRSGDVRNAAVDLLLRLPHSQLVQRQIERVKPLLQWKPGKFLRKATVEVTLPETCDKSMAPDGVPPNPPHGVGQKAWWLQNLVEAVPPHLWCEWWGATPAEIVQATRTDWNDSLMAAWMAAAQRHHALDWVRALLEYHDHAKPLPNGLTAVLPVEEQEKLILKALKADQLNAYLLSLILATSHQWSFELSRAVVDKLRGIVTAQKIAQMWPWINALESLALRMPPTFAAEAAQGWPTEEAQAQGWANPVQNFLSLLQFRYEMSEAFND